MAFQGPLKRSCSAGMGVVLDFGSFQLVKKFQHLHCWIRVGIRCLLIIQRLQKVFFIYSDTIKMHKNQVLKPVMKARKKLQCAVTRGRGTQRYLHRDEFLQFKYTIHVIGWDSLRHQGWWRHWPSDIPQDHIPNREDAGDNEFYPIAGYNNWCGCMRRTWQIKSRPKDWFDECVFL